MNAQQNIDKLLKDNNLVRKQIPQGTNSLMRAISDALYFTTQYHQQISKMLVQFLTKLLTTNVPQKQIQIIKQVPSNLSILSTNLALQQDYCQQPNFQGFDKINMELVSLMFRVKVNTYYLTDDGFLGVKIINKNYNRVIEVFKDENHYDSVYSRDFIVNVSDVQQIIFETFNQALDFNMKSTIFGWKVKSSNKVNIDFFNPILLVKKKEAARPRSLSDQFNNDSEKINDLYTNLETKFSKMFSETTQEKTSEEKDSTRKALFKDQNSSPIKQQEIEIQLEQIQNIKGHPPGINLPKQLLINYNAGTAETPKKPVIIDEGEQRYNGRLKFFDEGKNYGFIILDDDNSDIFVHYDDLLKAGLTKEFLRGLGPSYRSPNQVNHFGKGTVKPPRLSFAIMVYVGKYNKSRKAVDLKVLI